MEKTFENLLSEMPDDIYLDEFELCMQLYTERFDSQDIFTTNFSGPAPLSVFIDRQGTYYYITLLNVPTSQIEPNYYMNDIQWILFAPCFSICEKVTGNGTEGDIDRWVIMLRCPRRSRSY